MTHSLIRSLIRETLLTEEVSGKWATVYHGTKADPTALIRAIVSNEFRPGEGTGSMYGEGLYTVYDLRVAAQGLGHSFKKGKALSSDAPLSATGGGEYGANILKLKVNLDGYIIFDPDIASEVYGSDLTPDQQAERAGLDESLVSRLRITLRDYEGELSSEAAYPASRFLRGKVKGLVFTGYNDGHVVVIYDPTTAIPLAYKSSRDGSWIAIDRETRSQVFKQRQLFNSDDSLASQSNFSRGVSGNWEKDKSDTLKNLKKLEKLPIEQRSLRGDLRLSSYPIESLPAGLRVGGELNLAFSQIKSLPRGLQVGGSLDVRNTRIKSLPAGLRVGGDLNARNSDAASLGADLQVGGSLRISNTPIASIPAGLQVGGDIDIASTLVTSLPGGLKARRDLALSGAPIASLPGDLTVGRDLDLSYTPITSIPSGLKVGGSIGLSNSKVTYIPDGFSVEGSLSLRDTPIKSLPNGLSVGGDLHLANSSIATLPDGLREGGVLYLKFTSVKALPSSLQVGRSIVGFSGDPDRVPAHLKEKLV